MVKIIETTLTVDLLNDFKCSKNLTDAVRDPNPKIFLDNFVLYFKQKYHEESFKKDVELLKNMRDKAVAHNEAIEYIYFDFGTAERLLDFVIQLISIYGIAYYSTNWQSLLEVNAEQHASFALTNIFDLKEKLNCT